MAFHSCLTFIPMFLCQLDLFIDLMDDFNINLRDDSCERSYYGLFSDMVDDAAMNACCQGCSISDSLYNFFNHFLVTLSIRRRYVVADTYIAMLECCIKFCQLIDDFLVPVEYTMVIIALTAVSSLWVHSSLV